MPKQPPPIKVELTNAPLSIRVDAMLHRPARELELERPPAKPPTLTLRIRLAGDELELVGALEHERNNLVAMAERALDNMLRRVAPKKEGT